MNVERHWGSLVCHVAEVIVFFRVSLVTIVASILAVAKAFGKRIVLDFELCDLLNRMLNLTLSWPIGFSFKSWTYFFVLISSNRCENRFIECERVQRLSFFDNMQPWNVLVH